MKTIENCYDGRYWDNPNNKWHAMYQMAWNRRISILILSISVVWTILHGSIGLLVPIIFMAFALIVFAVNCIIGGGLLLKSMFWCARDWINGA